MSVQSMTTLTWCWCRYHVIVVIDYADTKSNWTLCQLCHLLCTYTFFINIFTKTTFFAEQFLPVHMGPM